MLILVTGSPGVGKTTLCRKVLEQLRTQHNFSVFGFVSAERKDEQGHRIGFDLIDLQTNERARLATTETITDERKRLGITKEEVLAEQERTSQQQERTSRSKPPMVGRYRVTLSEWEPLALRSLAEFRESFGGCRSSESQENPHLQNAEDQSGMDGRRKKKKRWGKEKEGTNEKTSEETKEERGDQEAATPAVSSSSSSSQVMPKVETISQTPSQQTPEKERTEPPDCSDAGAEETSNAVETTGSAAQTDQRAKLPEISGTAPPPENGKSLLVIDEIGKMELFSQQFVQQVRSVVGSNGSKANSTNAKKNANITAKIKANPNPNPTVPILMTVAVKGGGFIEEVKRMPQVTKFVEVTPQNRNTLFEEIMTEFVGGGVAE